MKHEINFFANADMNANNNEVLNFGGAEVSGMNNSNFSADAAPIQDSIESQPYIVKVANANTTEVTDQVILNAGQTYGKSGTNYGLDSGVTMTYLVPDVDIDQFLTDLLVANSYIGQLYIQSNNQANLTAPMKVSTYDVTGNSQGHIIDNVLDPYQNSTTAIISKKRFVWDKFTKLTISSIAASSYVTFRFYPIANNLTAQTKEFAQPVIARPADRGIGM